MSWYALMRWRGIRQLEDGLEALLEAVFEVAHATILSAYSRALAHGSDELHEAAGDLVVELAELVEAQSSRSTSAGRIRNIRQSGDVDDLAGAQLLVAHRVQEVEEAALRQVVRGELLDDASRAAARSRRRS